MYTLYLINIQVNSKKINKISLKFLVNIFLKKIIFNEIFFSLNAIYEHADFPRFLPEEIRNVKSILASLSHSKAISWDGV